jgi:hypothetical protein
MGKSSQTKIKFISDFKKKTHTISGRDSTAKEKVSNQLKSADDMLCIMDTDGYLKFANSAFKNILGFAGEEICTKSIYEFIHSNDRLNFSSKLQELLSKEIVYLESRCLCKDGSYKWMGWNVCSDSEEGLIYAVVHDVSKNKNSEKLFEKAAKQWTTAFDSLTDFVSIQDYNHRFVQVNEPLAKFLGIDPEDLIGRKCYEVIHGTEQPPEYCPLLLCKHKRETLTKEIYDPEFEKYFLISISPIFDKASTDGNIVHIMRDITEFKRTQEALKEAQEFLERRVKERTAELVKTNEELLMEIAGRKKMEKALITSQKRLDAVKRIGVLANSRLNLKEVLYTVLKGTMETSGAAVGIIFLKDPSNGCLKWGASIGLPKAFEDEFKNKYIRPGEGLTGQIAQKGEPVYIMRNCYNDPRIANMVFKNVEFNSFIGVPIYASKEIIGVMNILTKQPDVLSRYDIDLAAAIGSQVGSAIRNAQLFEERKYVENALRESNERYRMLFEESPISLWEKDFSGIKKYIEGLKKAGVEDFKRYFDENPGAVDDCTVLLRIVDVNRTTVHNYCAANKEDFLTNVHKIFCKETFELLKKEFIAVAENTLDLEAEGITRKLNGEKNNILIKWSVPPKYRSSLSRVLVSVVDVTEQKMAEQALRESERKFKKLSEEFNVLLDAIPDSLVLLSPDMKIMWANKAAASVLGKKAPELTGQDYPHICRNIFPFNKNYPSIRSFRTGREETAEISSKDGRVWDIRSFPLKDEKGKVKNVIELARDITTRVRMEKEAKLFQAKLIHANKMTSLGTLVSGVAHEINNPNSYIMSNTEMVTEIWKDAIKFLDEHYRKNGEFYLGGLKFSEVQDVLPKLLEGINDGAVRIKNIIDNLRSFAGPARTGLNGKVSAKEVIMAATSILDAQIRKYTDNYSIDCEDELPFIKGNFQQIEQVVINLIMNSLHALPDRKKGICVSAYSDKSGFVVIKVKDEGRGMTEDVLDRITEPFFTTKLDSGGTGLGLSISYAIVKEHRGSLEFTSKPGKGTTALVKLPRYDLKDF